ncbi:MAG: bifunctional phosphopantothenoylcysteine decarboxylase/phosphopantothenate--cysteine ligase CoaBC, partial [Ginsengibacter sp.]
QYRRFFFFIMLSWKKILLGVTGSIAAYKAVILLRLLVKAGAEVKVILTPSSQDFVTPLTFSTLSKNNVLTDLFDEKSWSNHVMLGRWADVMVIAPATCNTLSKMAAGLCDNLLLAVYLSATCPVIIAPAMDEDMWHHPATQSNLSKISSYSNTVLPVNNGELASGLTGDGRMAEPEYIIQFLQDFFFSSYQLKGEIALVNAGPTHEAIDPVRFISNHSSGKMGIAIAEELAKMGASVTLVLGPSDLPVSPGIDTIKVTSAGEMYTACLNYIPNSSIIIMAAAVADYTPDIVSKEKIKKGDDAIILNLKKTADILKTAGELKNDDQILVGFALETNDEKMNAKKKLTEKNADMIVLNSLNDDNAGFQSTTNKITIFDKRGREYNFDNKPKREVARDIINTIIQYKNA